MRSRRRAGIAIVGILALATGVVLSVILVQRSRSSVAIVEGATVPNSVTELWSVGGPEFVSAADFAGDDELVVAILDDGQPGSAAQLAAFDATTGAERWRSQISLQPSQVDIVARIADTVVVSVRRSIGTENLVGIDATGGQALWERPSATGAVFTIMEGPGVLAERDALEQPGRTQLIDVSTGETIGQFVGRIERASPEGMIEYVNAGSEFVVDDLSDRRSERQVLVGDIGVVDHAAVIDEHVLVARIDGTLDIVDTSTGQRTAQLVDADLGDPRRVIRTGTDRALIVTADGLTGVSIDSEGVGVDWTRPLDSLAIGGPNGEVFVLAAASGADRDAGALVIDARTGSDVTERPIPTTGADPIMTTNGVVVPESDQLGGSMAGFGFDGERLWTLSVPAVTRFGNGRVLTLTTGLSSGYTLTAYGEIE